MRVEMASSPGHGRPNEDFVGAGRDAVVLLDGAGIPGTEDICHHGVRWYSHTLGAALLANLTREGTSELAAALADSIEDVAARHRHTCDIANPSSPQATVAAVRFQDGRASYLILADTYVVLDLVDAPPRVITDDRELAVRAECTYALQHPAEGSAGYEQARLRAVAQLRGRRNRPGGYWIAKDDPRAALEAVTGSVPMADLRGAALLSNGASRFVDPYGLGDWPATLEGLRSSGPDALLRRIRAAEAGARAGGSLDGFHSADDATAAYCVVSR